MEKERYLGTMLACDTETGGFKEYFELDGQLVHGAMYRPLIEVGLILADYDENGIFDIENSKRLVVGIKQTPESLERFSEYALNMHTESGLLARLETGEGFDFVGENTKEAEAFIIKWLADNGAKAWDRKSKSGLIGIGNNIAFDLEFLDAQMNELRGMFFYRHNNVSTFDVASKSIWWNHDLPEMKKVRAHTAMSDIEESLEEMNMFTRAVFKL